MDRESTGLNFQGHSSGKDIVYIPAHMYQIPKLNQPANPAMSQKDHVKQQWVISARSPWLGINWKEWWMYRHLLGRLVRREFLLNYQQTMLGPVWILLQPILTLAVFVLVFGKVIGINTGGVPPVLFYLAGIVLWNFFNETFLGTAFTFVLNAELYSKVYFPRLIMPLASLAAQVIRLAIQFVLLLIMMLYYQWFRGADIHFSSQLLLVPIIVLEVGLISFSVGIIFSILTAKYRDLSNVVHLGLRLMMFVTPIFYPVSYIPQKIRWLADLNPLSPLFEWFRYVTLGEGTFTPQGILYSTVFSVLISIAGLAIFTRQGDKLIDVV